MTIGVYKSNKNAGFNRFHRKKTHKEWKHYFLDVDEYEQGEYTFQTEWVSAFKAMILKRNFSIEANLVLIPALAYRLLQYII